MNQTLKERLAKAALTEMSYQPWEMLSIEDQSQLSALVERTAETLQSDNVIQMIVGRVMAYVEPNTLLSKKLVSNEQVITGIISALFTHGNKGRWKS